MKEGPLMRRRDKKRKSCGSGRHSPKVTVTCCGDEAHGWIVALRCLTCGEIVGTGAAELALDDHVDEDAAHLIAMEEAKYEARQECDMNEEES
jgi:hypothetical protein